ncbi:MAG: hypothetical protein KBF93_05575 [Leptospiraceae bacterium]|nr:hypothetical protein [Leptospiraceae bacterium]
MRIQFLCIYLLCNTTSIAEEISKNYLLDHYRFREYSYGVGLSKETQYHRAIFGWINFGKEFFPNLDFSFNLYGANSQKKVKEVAPLVDGFYFSKQELQNQNILTFSPGIRYKYLSFYSNLESIYSTNKTLSFGINIYSEKSLFLFYKENSKENIRSYTLSILSGRSPAIGLAVTKEYSPEKVEWIGSISFSFQLELFQAGISHFAQNTKEENSFFVSKILRENSNSLFEKEINPYEEILDKESKTNPQETKQLVKKERIIYPISIEELLKFRIPLVVAIRIARASKSKEEYLELLSKLSPDIVKKCNKIQFDKSRAKR